jgi:LysR family transcriptional regulator, benzoate and cis,cis-muconate-responsive activator of ben and cat genes
MTPELRLIRYFVTVAEEGNVTRAARQLHIAQPSLSAALRQLEAQLGVELLRRDGRQLALTPAGELLRRRGRQLLADADSVAADVRGAAAGGRLRLGVSPTARYELAPRLLALCAAASAGVMIYTQEDTTGALVRGVADGHLDAAVTFCAGAQPPSAIELIPLYDERAVVHVAADHPVAQRDKITLAELADEHVLVAASPDSSGYSARVVAAFRDAGLEPKTLADPYPDLGVQAVRERRGVVIYVRSAYPERMDGSSFVALEPPLTLPFHLAVHREGRNPGSDVLIEAAQDLRQRLLDEQLV